VGSVVRLAIDDLHDIGDISLYCKVVWAVEKEKCSGLSFLNTNRVLFKKDLLSFNRLLEKCMPWSTPDLLNHLYQTSLT
jgi:hypothetical protein